MIPAFVIIKSTLRSQQNNSTQPSTVARYSDSILLIWPHTTHQYQLNRQHLGSSRFQVRTRETNNHIVHHQEPSARHHPSLVSFFSTSDTRPLTSFALQSASVCSISLRGQSLPSRCRQIHRQRLRNRTILHQPPRSCLNNLLSPNPVQADRGTLLRSTLTLND
jgi:hypothetical protein